MDYQNIGREKISYKPNKPHKIKINLCADVDTKLCSVETSAHN